MTADEIKAKLDDLQKQYSQGCMQKGDLDYRVECFKEDTLAVSARLKEINQEAAKLKQELADLDAKPVVPEVVDAPAVKLVPNE